MRPFPKRSWPLALPLAAAALAALGVLPSPAAPAAAQEAPVLRVMSYNLRYAHPTPPNSWPQRRPVMRELLRRERPDVIGTQEGVYAQLRDLEADLPGYAWIGVGREGGSRGEFMAVFYRTERLEPMEYDHFWLSDTPAVVGSRSWGNHYPRMVTWVRFRERRSGREFYLVNTHFDHQSQAARERGAELLLQRLQGFDAALPVIVTGDFNADAGANPAYALLTAPGALSDSWRAAGLAEPGFGTFHDFRGPEAVRGRARIDWILTRGPVATLGAEILTFARGGQYPSDHFPVVARLRLGAAAR